jgi:serine protease AprX
MIRRPSVSYVAVLLALLVVASPIGLAEVEQPRRAPLSSDLVRHLARQTGAAARVIVQGNPDELAELAARHGLRVHRALDHGLVVSATPAQLALLEREGAVDALTGDLPVATTMSVSNKTVAADQTWAGTSGLLGLIGAYGGVTGRGVGVAVIDSGIATSHKALYQKVVASISFVSGDTSTNDTFGHGTHIAGIIAGKSSAASGITTKYGGGVAPGAHLVNVRVLGRDGTGYTSSVIAGIDWVIANKTRYAIRVINLSLGHPVTVASANDPLCAAVARAVQAGLVVVASAGNGGKNAQGQTVLGSVTSPGSSPHAITVGALNTWGTVSRADDTVTTYSSRGPTRFDHAVKPDLGAPGNRLVSLDAPNSFLSTQYPQLFVAGSGTNRYIELSGTSMSAGMVSGAAALLLEAVPSSTPQRIKLALQTTTSFVADGGLVGSGTGSLDTWAARRVIGSNLLNSLLGSIVGGVLSRPSGAAFWDNGSMSDRLYEGTGLRLLSLLDLVGALLNPSRLGWGQLNLFGSGNPLGSVAPNLLIWGEIAFWTNDPRIEWGDTLYDPQGQQIIWSDAEPTEGQQIIWSDSHITGDPRQN